MKRTAVLIILAFICLFNISVKADDAADGDMTDYERGYIKGRFIVDTALGSDDQRLTNVLSKLPDYVSDVIIDGVNGQRRVLMIKLADKSRHDEAYAILRSASAVLNVQLDMTSLSSSPLSVGKPENKRFVLESEQKLDRSVLQNRFPLLEYFRLTTVYEGKAINIYLFDVCETQTESDNSAKEIYELLKSDPELLTVKTTFSSQESPQSAGTLFGDVNGDDAITSTDYLMIKRSRLRVFTLTSEQACRADINADGSIDATDYTLIKRHLLGIMKLTLQSAPVPKLTTVNAFCSLFGHIYTSERSVVIEHNVREEAPKCLEKTYTVHCCSRCGFTFSEKTQERFIYCHE